MQRPTAAGRGSSDCKTKGDGAAAAEAAMAAPLFGPIFYFLFLTSW